MTEEAIRMEFGYPQDASVDSGASAEENLGSESGHGLRERPRGL